MALGNGNGESGDALAVAFSLRVFCIQRTAESFQRVIVGLLEILERNGELLGAFRDKVLEVALIGAILDDQLPVFQSAPHAQMELVRSNGLRM